VNPPPTPKISINTAATVRGSARAIQQHSEQDANASDVSWSVWTFRIERYDEVTGEHLPPLPVQVRGKSFDGSINEDDEVEVSTESIIDGTVHTTWVRNLTTHSLFKVKAGSHHGLIIFLVFAAMLVGSAIYFQRYQSHKMDEWIKQQQGDQGE